MRFPSKAEIVTGVTMFGLSAATAHAEVSADTTRLASQCVDEAAALPLESLSETNKFASQASIVGRRGLHVTFNPLSLGQAIGAECMDSEAFSVDRFTNIRVTQNGKKIASMKNVLTSGEDNGSIETHTLQLKRGAAYRCGARINVQAVSEVYASLYDDESTDPLAYERATRSLATFAVKCS